MRDQYKTDFGAGRILAGESDGVLLLGLAQWTPWRGWQPGFAWPVERTDRPVDAVAAYYSWDFEGEQYPHVLFGYVNDRRVGQVLFRAENGQLKEAVLRTGGAGQRYFLEEYVTQEPGGTELVLLDERGTGMEGGQLTVSFMSLVYDWDM